MAFYAHELTRVYASHYQGAPNELALMSVLGDNAAAAKITDTQLYTARRIFAVGDLSTVAAVIAHAERIYPASGWARWKGWCVVDKAGACDWMSAQPVSALKKRRQALVVRLAQSRQPRLPADAAAISARKGPS